MNKIFIVGNLTREPVMRATANGTSVCSFTIAVDRRFLSGGDTVTDYFTVKAWRQLGENCSRFLAKGRKVAVVGELQARQYKDANGDTRMSLDVNADEVEFLSPRTETAAAQNKQNKLLPPEEDGTGYELAGSDIPF